jgi:hypothetical protein
MPELARDLIVTGLDNETRKTRIENAKYAIGAIQSQIKIENSFQEHIEKEQSISQEHQQRQQSIQTIIENADKALATAPDNDKNKIEMQKKSAGTLTAVFKNYQAQTQQNLDKLNHETFTGLNKAITSCRNNQGKSNLVIEQRVVKNYFTQSGYLKELEKNKLKALTDFDNLFTNSGNLEALKNTFSLDTDAAAQNWLQKERDKIAQAHNKTIENTKKFNDEQQANYLKEEQEKQRIFYTLMRASEANLLTGKTKDLFKANAADPVLQEPLKMAIKELDEALDKKAQHKTSDGKTFTSDAETGKVSIKLKDLNLKNVDSILDEWMRNPKNAGKDTLNMHIADFNPNDSRPFFEKDPFYSFYKEKALLLAKAAERRGLKFKVNDADITNTTLLTDKQKQTMLQNRELSTKKLDVIASNKPLFDELKNSKNTLITLKPELDKAKITVEDNIAKLKNEFNQKTASASTINKALDEVKTAIGKYSKQLATADAAIKQLATADASNGNPASTIGKFSDLRKNTPNSAEKRVLLDIEKNEIQILSRQLAEQKKVFSELTNKIERITLENKGKPIYKEAKAQDTLNDCKQTIEHHKKTNKDNRNKLSISLKTIITEAKKLLTEEKKSVTPTPKKTS